jgi:hypothetical protein
MSAEALRTRGVDWSRVRPVAHDPELPQRPTSSEVVPEQLELFDRFDDGLDFGDWMLSLPLEQT